jgi:hypothetical protein
MVVVGSDRLYAIHLPRPEPPFDHQAIWEIDLSDGGYRSMRRKYGTSARLTLRTEPLSLADLRGDGGRPPVRTSFEAELFLGHFRHDGDPVGHTTVRVHRTLAFARIGPTTHRPPLQYLVFGREPDLFLVHKLSTASDFDQVLHAQRTDAAGARVATDRRAVLVQVPQRPEGLDPRLLPGQHVEATIVGADATMPLRALAEVYLDTDDLTS